MNLERLPCPCCAYQPASGSFIICAVCWWEDDPIQLEDPGYAGGANERNLNQARESYRLTGVSDPKCKGLERQPRSEEIPLYPANSLTAATARSICSIEL